MEGSSTCGQDVARVVPEGGLLVEASWRAGHGGFM